MRINNNIAADNTHRMYKKNAAALAKSTKKLSSGYRVNTAADDAAGLAISEKMRAQIRGMNQSSRNVQDGVSLLQSADGYLQAASDILQRLNELANQAATGTLSEEDIGYVNNEVKELFAELESIITTSTFNGIPLFDAVDENGDPVDLEFDMTIQAGANTADKLVLNWNVSLAALLKGDDWDLNPYLDGFEDQDAANAALDQIQASIDYLNAQRAKIGAFENRLEYRQANLDNAAENLSAAESRIRDVDMAKEMTEYTKQNILVQASTAMQAQANSQPNLVLQLLK